MKEGLLQQQVLTISNEALVRGLNKLDLTLDFNQIGKLLQYLSLIGKWNRVYNLTAIHDPAKMVSLHLLDSLAVVPIISGPRLLDVGTGAGLPGIPIAIVRPELAITLIESNNKKTAFLQQASMELALENVRIIHARVEDWRGGLFDTIISRAFSNLSQFVACSQHLLAIKGVFVAMKGGLPQDEIARLPESFRVRQIHRMEIPDLDAERHLIMIEKT